MKSNQVIIAYKTSLLADGLELIIEGASNYCVIGKIPYGNELVELLSSFNETNIVIIELNCPLDTDLIYIDSLIEMFPTLKVFLLSHLPQIKMIKKILESRINAYLLKSCSKQDMIIALDKLAENKNYFCAQITKTLVEKKNDAFEDDNLLSSREKEILGLLVSCKTNIEIANFLGLSENTIKTHRRNIQNKFGVNNLIGMIRYACRANLLDFENDEFCLKCPHFTEISN